MTPRPQSQIGRTSMDLVKKYTDQPLKFEHYEYYTTSPPMRSGRRSSLANRIIVLLTVIGSLVVLFLVWQKGNIFSIADRQCIQDEWNGNTTALGTADFHTHFRISFADQEHNFSWIHLPRLNGKSPKILMMVMSRPDGLARRNVLRDTWMNPNMSRIVNDGTMKGIFVCGKGVDQNDDKMMKLLSEEAKIFGDMLIVDMPDNYTSLTYKTITSLLFGFYKLPDVELIGKIDEDVLFFPDQLYPLINNTLSTDNATIYGHKYREGVEVNHGQTDRPKWSISRDAFKCELFPEYISGPCYFVTKHAAQQIMEYTKYRKYIHIEDVFITGLIAADAHVQLQHIDNIYTVHTSTSDRFIREMLAWHNKKTDEQYRESFEKLMKTRCKACIDKQQQ